MRRLKQWLAVVGYAAAALGLAITGSANADCCCGDSDRYDCEHFDANFFMERDFQTVQDWIKLRRAIPLQDKACNLMISGDIRMAGRYLDEKRDGEHMRGKGAPRDLSVSNGAFVPRTLYDIDFNLRFDYRGECTWAVAEVGFDNKAGINRNPRQGFRQELVGWDPASGEPLPVVGPLAAEDGTAFYEPGDPLAWAGDPCGIQGSGSSCRVSLRKAFFGYNLLEDCEGRLDIEIGRRNLYDIFDSRVQFASRADGILLRYGTCLESVGDFYVNGSAFVIDYRSNHYGFAFETGITNICDCGFELKYSLIDWKMNGTNAWGCEDPFGMKYITSQILAAYNFEPDSFCDKAQLYAAFLINHAAKRDPRFNNRRENIGFYVGASIGEIVSAGDWAFDVNYQYIEAATFMEKDLTGIGRGNVHCVPISLSNWSADSDSTGAIPPENVADFGWLNYQGIHAELLYAVTDQFVLKGQFDYSKNIRRNKSNFTKVEVAAMYSF